MLTADSCSSLPTSRHPGQCQVTAQLLGLWRLEGARGRSLGTRVSFVQGFMQVKGQECQMGREAWPACLLPAGCPQQLSRLPSVIRCARVA